MPTRERRAEELGVPVDELAATSFHGPAPDGDVIRFRVYGQPVPQGSYRAIIPKRGHRAILVANRRNELMAWRQDIASQAAKVDVPEPIAVAVFVSLKFYLHKGNSVPRKRRWPVVTPDIDKLARAALDALVAGGLLADDKYVVELAVTKDYADTRPPGVDIRVRRLDEEAAA